MTVLSMVKRMGNPVGVMPSTHLSMQRLEQSGTLDVRSEKMIHICVCVCVWFDKQICKGKQ